MSVESGNHFVLEAPRRAIALYHLGSRPQPGRAPRGWKIIQPMTDKHEHDPNAQHFLAYSGPLHVVDIFHLCFQQYGERLAKGHGTLTPDP